MFWWYCDGERDMDKSLPSTQLIGSKELEETRRKDNNPITSHTIGWQGHHDHLLGLCESVLLVDFLPRGITINGSYYAPLLHQLHSSIREKRPGKLTRGVLLLHDNVSVHKSSIT